MAHDSQRWLPLSEHQIAWVHHVEAREHSPTPHALSSVVCQLPLDEELLAVVVNDVVAGFDELCASLDLEPGRQPRRVVHDRVRAEINFDDLRGQPEHRRSRLIADALLADAERPFDLSRAPLARFLVHRVDDSRFHLSTVTHPALLGRRALSTFHADVVTRYRDSLDRVAHREVARRANLTPRAATAEDTDSSVREWAESFEGFSPGSADFWTTDPGDDEEHFGGELRPLRAQWVELPSNLADALLASAATAGVSISDLLLAAHVKAVGAVSGRSDVVSGVEVEDAGARGAEPFNPTTTMPVRISLAPSTWADLAARVSASVSSARRYRHLSHLRVQRLLDLGRLVDSTFVYTEVGLEACRLDEEACTPVSEPGLQVDESASASYTHIPFAGAACAEFFRGAESRRLALRITAGNELSSGQLRELTRLHVEVLRSCVRLGDEHKSFATLSQSHRDLVMRRWNSDVRRYPARWCVHEMVEQQAARTPDAVAVVDADRELTYRELNARANRLARRLRASGIGVGDVVGVQARRDSALVTSFLGVLKSGAAYLPLDPQQPVDRATYMLEDSGAQVVLTDAVYADAVPDGPWKVVRVDGPDMESAGIPDTDLGRTSTPDDLMYVIYTSGSTGLPKGVEVPHSGVVNYLCWCVEAYASKGMGGAPVFSSVAFDMVVPNLYTPLVMGQRVCMLEESLDTAGIAQRLADLAPFSFIKLTPGQLGVLGELLDPEDARRLTAMLAVGADAFPLRILRSWRRVDSRTPVINEYGPTEASVGNSVHFVDGSEQDELLPIGRAIPNTTMYVLDEDLAPVPIGVPGELYIGGACVVRGYRNRPELTAEKFIRDPFSDEPRARMYRTGDIGRWLPSGTLAFLGRVDDQVKIRGYRVEPAEVESTLTEHPGISESVVTVVGSTRETYALAGYYVGSAGLRPDSVRAFLAQRLPEYLVPSFLMPITAVPLNPNGKVDRKALPAVGSGRAARARQKAAASGATGRSIRQVWQEVFGIGQVNLEDVIADPDGGTVAETQFALRLSGILGITARDAIQAFVRARSFGELCERLAAQPSREPTT